MMKFKEIAQEIRVKVLDEIKSQSSSDLDMTLEDYAILKTNEILKNEILSGKLNQEIREKIYNKFTVYVSGTEYDTQSVKEHFQNFLETEIQSIQINFHGNKKPRVTARVPVSIFGAISSWAAAILAARKLVSKFPNKYPIKSSYYWRKKVYPTSKLDDTMALRLSFAYGYAPYIRMIESGTSVSLSSSYGGFPTPIYGGKRPFVQIMAREIEDTINEFINREYEGIIQSVLNEIGIDISKIPLTKKLSEVLAETANEEVIKIVNEIKTEGDTKRVLSVIIKIGKDYYRIIKTKKGNWGLRFDISRYRRR